MSDPSGHLDILTATSLRIPDYLDGYAEELREQGDGLAGLVKSFLKKPAIVKNLTVKRALSKPPQEGQICFDIAEHGDTPALRLLIDAEDAGTFTKFVFGGPVDEPTVQKGVMGALAQRYFGYQLGLPDPMIPEFISRKPAPLSDEPVMVSEAIFTIDEAEDAKVTLEIARAKSDRGFPPPPLLTVDVINSVPFLADAELGRVIFKVSQMMQWKKGLELPLPNASLEDITVRARAGKEMLKLVTGEMGSVDGRRSLRLTDISKVPGGLRTQDDIPVEAPFEMPEFATTDPEAAEEGFGMAMDIDMDFANSAG